MIRLRVLFMLLVLCLAACKKDKNSEDNDQQDCIESTFQVSLGINGIFIQDLCEDLEGNIILLGRTNDNTKLIKLDPYGLLMWEKDIDNTYKPLEVISLNDNSILLLRESEPVVTYCDALYDFAWIQAGVFIEYNCIPFYELGEPMCFTYEAEVELMKFNQHGDELWSKILPDFYAGGNSLLLNNDNSIVLMTAFMYGYQPDYVMDNDVFLDTVNYPLDKNQLSFYEISESGELNWTTRVDNINNRSWSDHFFPIVNFDKVDDKIVIKTIDELIILNENGQQQSRFKFVPDYCSSELYYLFGMEKNFYLISGTYSDWSSGVEIPYPYTELRTMDHEVVWNKDIISWIIDANADNYLTYSNGSGLLNCYNQDGTLKWKTKFTNASCAKLSCLGGVIISSYNFNKVMVTKIDANGEL